jgi:hypothetical protein
LLPVFQATGSISNSELSYQKSIMMMKMMISFLKGEVIVQPEIVNVVNTY